MLKNFQKKLREEFTGLSLKCDICYKIAEEKGMFSVVGIQPETLILRGCTGLDTA